MRKELLSSVSSLGLGLGVVVLGLAVANPAAANPKNKFSDNATARVVINTVSGRNVTIESGNVEREVLATNILTATFSTGSITLGDAAASAAASASAQATAEATADANATARASASASADATAAASSNSAVNNNRRIQNANHAASASRSGVAATATATADASASASASAAASASASAAAAAGRGGDLRNASIVMTGNAMQRAAGAFAMNLGTAQFNNLNTANAIGANVSRFTIESK